MKKIFTILAFLSLLVLTFSCNSDDDSSVKEEARNRLILKRISSQGLPFSLNFDKKGRFSYVEDTVRSRSIITAEMTYDEKGRRKKLENYNTSNSIEWIYDANDRIEKMDIYHFPIRSGYLPDTINYVIQNITYSNNLIETTVLKNGIKSNSTIFTFKDSEYDQLEKFEFFDVSTNEKLFEETYEYDSNRNLITNTILVGNNTNGSTSKFFKYDDKRNPFYESTNEFYLNEILDRAIPESLMFDLISLSPNNIITHFQKLDEIILEYNDQEYPIKETTIFNDNINSVRIFEYY